MEVVSARSEDIPAIREVLHCSWFDTYPNEKYGIVNEDLEDFFEERNNPENLAKIIQRTSSRTHFLVAKVGGRVVGVILVVLNRRTNEIKSLYVDPPFYRQGIGTTLVQEGQKFFNPTKNDVVRVVPYNHRAIEFYKTFGFKQFGKMILGRLVLPDGTKIPEIKMRVWKKKK